MQVDTNIAEADVGRLAPGMTATFTVDAYPGRDLHRKDPRGSQLAAGDPERRDLRRGRRRRQHARCKLKPGMTANIEVVYAERADALRVAERRHPLPPARGVSRARSRRRVPLDRKKLVWVLRAGAPTPVVFKPGVSDGVVTEVVEGELQAGDQVITEAIAAQSAARADPVSGAVEQPLIELEHVTKIYTLGEVEVRALNDVSLADLRAASSSPSWAPRARASRR